MSVVISPPTLLPGKLIVYDGACTLCLQLRDKALQWEIIPAQLLADYWQLDPALQSQVDSNRFKNEMALIDTEGGETIYGAHGIAAIFSAKWLLAKWFFRIPGVFFIFQIIYKTLTYHRSIIPTPRKDMPICDSVPEIPVSYRRLYEAYCGIIAIGVTFFFGASLPQVVPGTDPVKTGFAMLLIAGTGWIVQLLSASQRMGSMWPAYELHLFTIMRKGVMPLLLVSLLMQVARLEPFTLIPGGLIGSPRFPMILPAVAVVYSSAMMLRQHYLRMWRLGDDQSWTLRWFVTLQITAIFWVYLLFIYEAKPLFYA